MLIAALLVVLVTGCRRDQEPVAPVGGVAVVPGETATGPGQAASANDVLLRTAGLGAALMARVLEALPDAASQIHAMALSAGGQALLLRVTDGEGVGRIERLVLEPSELDALEHARICRDGERCGDELCPACGPPPAAASGG
jgi:hypothetical protein